MLVQNRKILVVTATLGDRDSIIRTCESVKKYGKGLVEHVIITNKIHSKALSEKFPDCKILIENSHQKGIYFALNQVFFEFKGEYKYMTFINDDDYWDEGFGELINTMINSDLELVYGKVNYVTQDEKILTEQASSYRYNSFLNLFHNDIILFTQQATIIKAHTFFELNGFNTNYKLAADTEFWIRFINKFNKIKFLDLICSNYTIQEGQLSSDKKLQQKEHDMIKEQFPMKEKIFAILDVLLFRFYNIKIYLKRFLKCKNINITKRF